MKHRLLVVPIGVGVGLTTVTRGLDHALKSHGLKTTFLDPVTHNYQEDGDFNFERFENPIPIQAIESLLSQGEEDKLLEFLIGYFNFHEKDADVVVIQGIISTQIRTYALELNAKIASALDAEIIFVTAPGHNSPHMISDQIEIAAKPFGGIMHPKILGCMINKVGAPIDQYGNARIDLFDPVKNGSDASQVYTKECPVFQNKKFKLLGSFPWDRKLMAPRVEDIQKFLNAKILAKGQMKEHRVMHLVMVAATIENMAKTLKSDVMVITSGDRADIVITTCMAYVNGIQIAAILLTGGHLPEPNTMELCTKAIEMGLPILSVQTDSLRTSIALQNLNMEIPADDVERQNQVKESIARRIDKQWIEKLVETHPVRYLSPPAFRYSLIEKAKKANKKIILPEGDEPRILKAAALCAQRKIARLVLLGNKEKLRRLIAENQLPINGAIEIVDCDEVREKYVIPFYEKRKHKGVSENEARGYLQDPITLGTMMVACGDADGLVAGAVHTTAHTVLPALKLIKTKPNCKLVSSVFFMCLSTQVLVYGDCAVNQNPSFEDLADIAIQSADSAAAFGIEPRVAMISYSTGKSGTGADVEKIHQATNRVKELRPDILIDGPLQYDAAFSPEVARTKAPDSSVAGKATVYIFPDLNTANTTYKAVQRSANVLSIGPMLQGLNKPVNDLSRGATVEDIVFTIAITAIQAAS